MQRTIFDFLEEKPIGYILSWGNLRFKKDVDGKFKEIDKNGAFINV